MPGKQIVKLSCFVFHLLGQCDLQQVDNPFGCMESSFGTSWTQNHGIQTTSGVGVDSDHPMSDGSVVWGELSTSALSRPTGSLYCVSGVNQSESFSHAPMSDADQSQPSERTCGAGQDRSGLCM